MYYLLAEKSLPPLLLLATRAKGSRFVFFVCLFLPGGANSEEPMVGGRAEQRGGAVDVFGCCCCALLTVSAAAGGRAERRRRRVSSRCCCLAMTEATTKERKGVERFLVKVCMSQVNPSSRLDETRFSQQIQIWLICFCRYLFPCISHFRVITKIRTILA